MIDREDLKDGTKVMGMGIVGWLLVMGLALLTAGAVAYTQPWFMRRDTMNTRQSMQYITTRQASLRQFKTSWDGLEARVAEFSHGNGATENAEVIRGLRGQQHAIVLQMRQERDLIPRDTPEDINVFLAGQP